MTLIPPTLFQTALLNWYDQQGRNHLPWRQNISAYRVWVSEIMLQQTQVNTVIPFFNRFMERFPDLNQLAAANEDEVLELWTGLGYYSRARNLHKTARKIMTDFEGNFPQTLAQMQELPGIGRSTAGAILAIAMNQATAILDGNVKRILSRLHMIAEPSASAQEKRLWPLAESYTPVARSGDYTQAIMDLGATICLRSNPLCNSCPLQPHCEAFHQQRVMDFPPSKKQNQRPKRRVNLLIFHDAEKDCVLLEKRPPVGIWGGLWSFPECPENEDISKFCYASYGYRVSSIEPLPSFKHIFSHFELWITPQIINFEASDQFIAESNPHVWHRLSQSNPARGFAAPVQRLLKLMKNFKSADEEAKSFKLNIIF